MTQRKAHHCNRCGHDEAFVFDKMFTGYPHYYVKCLNCEMWTEIYSDTPQGAVQRWKERNALIEDVSELGFVAFWD